MNGTIFPQVTIGSLVEKVVKPVSVEPDAVYQQIGIRSHGKGLFDKPPVTGKQLGNKRVFWVEPHCFVVNIVFAWEQAVGKTLASDVGKIASHRFPMYRAKPSKVDIDFLTYLFKTEYGKEVLGLASPGGAGRNKTLGQDEFLKIRIRVPPIAEQQRIAEILSTWDRAIAAQKKLVANARAQKKALMQQLLTAKKRLPGYKADWIHTPIGKIARIYDGTHMTPDYVGEGVPFYSVEHLTSGNFSDTKFISEAVFAEESRRVRIAKNDILMTRIGDIGTAKLINWNVRASFYVSLALIKPDSSICPAFLAHFISTSSFQRDIHKRTIHVAFPKKINLGEIGDCSIAVPELPEQEAIAELLTNADQEIAIESRNLEALTREKSALMQQLLTGKRRVKVEEEAVA